MKGRPPLFLFVMCLGFFGIVLLTLGHIISTSEQLSNPDATASWGKFLDELGTREFCLIDRLSLVENETTVSAAITSERPLIVPNNETAKSDTKRDSVLLTASVLMQINMWPTSDFVRSIQNVSVIAGEVRASDIGYVGFAKDELVEISFELPENWSSQACVPSNCISIYTCVSVNVPQHVLPARDIPQQCHSSLNDTAITRLQLKAKPATSALPHYCRNRPKLQFKRNVDASLRVYLSVNDKKVINLHLLHTSYFLFAMMVFFLSYGVMKSRPSDAQLHEVDMKQPFVLEDL